MRISDWSSDVCSSDLRCARGGVRCGSGGGGGRRAEGVGGGAEGPGRRAGGRGVAAAARRGEGGRPGARCLCRTLSAARDRCGRRDEETVRGVGRRSEEHTSELQTLMRITYAVLRLKKKKRRKCRTKRRHHKWNLTDNKIMYQVR